MFATYYQIEITQDHNRRSVMPYLGFYQSGPPELPTISISVKNTGLGPAIVTGIDFKIDDDVVSYDDGVDWLSISKHLEKKLSVNLKDQGIMFTNFVGKPLIPAGERIDLFVIHPNKISPENILLMENIMETLDPSICYRSIYTDKYFLKGASDLISDKSCNIKGTYKILGAYVRFKLPWKNELSHNEIFGD